MREMKDSGVEWVGEIPKNWDVLPVKYMISINNGGDPKTEGDIPVYGSGSNSFRTCGEFKNGPTVLLGRKGTVNIPQYITGKYWNVDTAFDAKPIDDRYNLKYFYYNALCFDYDNYSTQTALPSMTQGTYYNLRIIDIPRSLQDEIVVFLDRKCAEIDALSADIKSEIDTLEAYKRSVITVAVTKGLDKKVPMKDSGIEWMKKIPYHWKAIPFKRVLHERNEKNNPVKTSERLSLSIGLGVTTYAEKTTNLDRFKEDVSQYKLAHIGDLVMNSMNMIVGATGISKYYGCVSPAYYTFYDTESDHVIAKYCEYLFLTPLLMGELHKLGKGIMFIERGEGKVNTCRLKVSRYDLGHILLPIPPMSEMRIIVNYLNKLSLDIDEIIAKKQEQLTILAEYKKSIIYEYVTGKKEVPMA